jgi:hypothetical protein
MCAPQNVSILLLQAILKKNILCAKDYDRKCIPSNKIARSIMCENSEMESNIRLANNIF